MSLSRRFPRSRFQPGIAAMYACTGASPSAFAICGLPPERSLTGLALGFAFRAESRGIGSLSARSGARRRGLQAAPEVVRERPEHAGRDRPAPRLRAV